MEEWANRMGENDYHGGKIPDEADFTVRDCIFLSLFLQNH
jgi:hypothetical protein